VIQRNVGVEYLKDFLDILPNPPFRGDGQKYPINISALHQSLLLKKCLDSKKQRNFFHKNYVVTEEFKIF
jgi:hypothetical protein